MLCTREITDIFDTFDEIYWYSPPKKVNFLLSFFRLFVFSHGVFLSFRLFAWRLFDAKRRKDEMAQFSHHIYIFVNDKNKTLDAVNDTYWFLLA